MTNRFNAPPGAANQNRRVKRKPLIICSSTLELPFPVQATLVKLGLPMMHVQNLFELSQTLLEQGGEVEAIVVLTEHVSRAAPWIVSLATIRKHCPNVPVVLASSDFAADDFTARQLTLSDVALRFPVTVESMLAGLMQARENNQIWVDRSMQAMRAESGVENESTFIPSANLTPVAVIQAGREIRV